MPASLLLRHWHLCLFFLTALFFTLLGLHVQAAPLPVAIAVGGNNLTQLLWNNPDPGPSTVKSFTYIALVGVGANIRYFCVVRPVQANRETLQSNEVGGYDPQVDADEENARRNHLSPPKMRLIVAATGSRRVTLFWTKLNKASSYNVYRNRNEAGPFRRIASHVKTPDRNPGVVSKFLYSDSNLPKNVSFYYFVKAVRRGREIAYSNTDDGRAEDNAIPWDTGDTAQILKLERGSVNKALDPEVDPRTGKVVPAGTGLLSIYGPDGAVYTDFSTPEKKK